MSFYEQEIRELEQQKSKNSIQPGTIFYGSSTIRLWENLQEDFKTYEPLNLGFGGSTLAACTWFFDRLVACYETKRIIIYAGDNDLGDGRHPEEVFIFFQQLADRIYKRYGEIPCYFISIKLSIAREDLLKEIEYTNKLIENEILTQKKNWSFISIYHQMLNKEGSPKKEYFEQDGLHLSSKGYELWKQIIDEHLNN